MYQIISTRGLLNSYLLSFAFLLIFVFFERSSKWNSLQKLLQH